jgi:hypothetical protein
MKMMIIIVIMATTKGAGAAAGISQDVAAKSTLMHFFLVFCFTF